jgi:hypothetical protein
MAGQGRGYRGVATSQQHLEYYHAEPIRRLTARGVGLNAIDAHEQRRRDSEWELS